MGNTLDRKNGIDDVPPGMPIIQTIVECRHTAADIREGVRRAHGFALTDETAKQKWFGGTAGSWELLERHMDVRVGGSERLRGRWEGGVVSTFDAVYHDVIANERLVYSWKSGHAENVAATVAACRRNSECQTSPRSPWRSRAARRR